MKKLIYILLLLFAFTIQVFSKNAADWIPDPILRQIVKQHLEIPEESILTVEDIKYLKGLTMHIKNDITSLQGLEHAIELRFLHIGRGKISDLTPLMFLANLETLKLHDNEIVDISPLAGLVNLRELKLQNNQIVDITPLSALIHLQELGLYNNQILDFSPLANLTNLRKLYIQDNPGIDISHLEHLQILDFRYNAFCEINRVGVKARVLNRYYPSVVTSGENIINLPSLSRTQRIAYHDLYFRSSLYNLRFVETDQEGLALMGPIQDAIDDRQRLQAENPNLIVLAAVRYYSAVGPDEYPEDWPHWLRDSEGNRVISEEWQEGLLDFTQEETQKWAIDQAKAIAACGLFDGVFFDHWNEWPRLSGYRTLEKEHTARDNILQGIRAAVDKDFLILVNANHEKIPRWAEYINGIWMETWGEGETDHRGFGFEGRGYTRDKLILIEDTLRWAEENLREPRINSLEGFGVTQEPPDSSINLKWMRAFTTMSLTHSDGYVVYNIGIAGLEHSHPWNNEFLAQRIGHAENLIHAHNKDHYWYDFWDAPLGRPIGEKSTLYNDIEGLFIREYTNGWAVFNRSGQTQTIRLPQTMGVSSELSAIDHRLADLDGEIYIKRLSDLNADGVVNILDLVIVAGAIGTANPSYDLNADGSVNILDLVIVANELGETQ